MLDPISLENTSHYGTTYLYGIKVTKYFADEDVIRFSANRKNTE